MTPYDKDCNWYQSRICSIIPALFFAVFLLFSGALQANAAAAFYEPANYVLIRGGEFTMGSPEGEVGRAEITAFWQKYGIEYSETQHQVRVSNFSMSRYAVTVAEFRRFGKHQGTRQMLKAEAIAGFGMVVNL